MTNNKDLISNIILLTIVAMVIYYLFQDRILPGTRCTQGVVFGCKRKDWIIKPPYMLHNNSWGAPSNETIEECVYYCKDNDLKMGWKWKRENPKLLDGVHMPIFPEVIVGRQPWDWTHQSTWNKFPIKIADINSWIFDLGYEYLLSPKYTDTFNFTLETWVVDQIGPTPDNTHLKNEIMIWIHQTPGRAGPGDYNGTFNDGYHKYERYTREAGGTGAPLDSFLMTEGNKYDQTYYTFDMKKILDYLISIGRINSQNYIHGVELGNEVGRGSGMIEINKFNMEINGDKLV